VTDERSLRDAIRGLAEAAHPNIYEPHPSPLPGREGMPGFAMPVDHPASAAFDQIAAVTPPLRQLYEAGDDGVFVVSNIGSGWRIQPRTLATGIVGSAARRILFLGGDTESPKALAAESERVLDDLVALLSGHSIDVPALSAFGGIALQEGVDLELPWGRARNPSSFEAQLLLFTERRPSLILEAPVSTKLHVQVGPAEDSVFEPGALARITRASLLLPLAALLGIERESYVVPQWVWQTVLFPAEAGAAFTGSATPSQRMDRYITPATLDDRETQALSQWARTVDDADHPSINVAIRRLLSAVRERVQYEDALIDAVVAMESLFGHRGDTEVTFRVTSAIALLLEPTPAERAHFKSQLGKVYKTRSTVVHGGTPDPKKLHEHKEEAIRVAVRCLRTLFADHPHLIPDSNRGMRLILRTEQPPI
jgi:Apea-like HEPN